MFGNVTALAGLHVPGKYRTKHDAHTGSSGMASGVQHREEAPCRWRAAREHLILRISPSILVYEEKKRDLGVTNRLFHSVQVIFVY